MLIAKRWLILLLAVSLAAAGPVALLAAGDTPESPAARAAQAKRSLAALGKAMHAYAEKHGDTFPLPAVPLKPKAKELPLGLSWRVQLLPYLGEEALYKQFKLDEPWDSPANKALLPKMPKIFAAPRVPGTEDKPGHTHYEVFTTARFQGDNATRPIFPNVYMATLAPKADRPSVSRIADGTRNTILIAEATRAVPWTKPEDLPYAGDLPIPALGHAAPGVIFVCMADGEVRAVSKRAKAADLRALITSFGGEVVDPEDVDPKKFPGAAPKTGTVSGKVLFKGVPLAGGWVMYHSQDGREFSATLLEDGTYEISGVPVGTARVAVGTSNDLLPPFLAGKQPRVVTLPRRYAEAQKSGLTLEVQAGRQTHDLNLD
jgi:hypothetical protein